MINEYGQDMHVVCTFDDRSGSFERGMQQEHHENRQLEGIVAVPGNAHYRQNQHGGQAGKSVRTM